MAGFFREPERRQLYLLPVNMLEWVPNDDIAHLVLDVISGMDLSRLKGRYQEGGVGAPALSPGMMLAVLIYGYCHGYTSSRKLERLCIRDAGFRMIVGDETPDHATIARFRRKHLADVQVLFTEVLKLCRKAGLARLGLVALDGTKVKGNASLDANRTAGTIDEEVKALLVRAEEEDRQEDALYGCRRGDELPEDLKDRHSRLARLQACRDELRREAEEQARKQEEKIEVRQEEETRTGQKRRGRKPKPATAEVSDEAKANVTDPESRIMKTRKGWVQGYNAQAVVTEDQIIVAASVVQDRNDVKQLNPMLALAWANLALVEDDPELGVALADAGYWSEENAGTETDDCQYFIATRKDWKQRQTMREQGVRSEEIPDGLSAREKMEWKLLTESGKALYKKRGQTIEPVFGQMKGTQGADEFRMRGLELCDGEWKLHAATHNLKKLHSKCVRFGQKGLKWLH